MINRRKLLSIGSAAGLMGMGFANSALASNAPNPIRFERDAIPPLPEDILKSIGADTSLEPAYRRVSLYNIHTGEATKVVYKEAGQLIPDAMAEVNKVLRDYRNDQMTDMDVALMDMLDNLARKLEINTEFNVISGYRSPATNAMLHERSSGVAKHSMHILGKAIDIRVPGVRLKHLRNVAKEMRVGGVGYYASSDFVHVDTGKVRYW